MYMKHIIHPEGEKTCCLESKIELAIDAGFTLHGEFYAEKYSKVLLWNAWKVLKRMHRKKKNMTLSLH